MTDTRMLRGERFPRPPTLALVGQLVWDYPSLKYGSVTPAEKLPRFREMDLQVVPSRP